MSTGQGVYAQPVPAAVRRTSAKPARAVSGAGLLSAAMVVSGILTYGFLVLAARTLSPTEYGRIGVLWGGMFIVAIVLFRPLEQTASRSISDRRARGDEVRSVIRSVSGLATVLLLLVAVVAAGGWSQLAGRLFGGDSTLMAMLVVGIGFYGLSYVVRGLVGGVLWFDGYGINLVADGLGRLLLALPLLIVATRATAGIAIAGAGLLGALAPLIAGRRRLRPLLAAGGGSPFRTRQATRFALPAATIAASDQLLVNGAPLLVMLGGGAHATRAAGVAFAATMLVRAPVYVFQGVAAALLPNLTHLNATDGFRRLERELARTARPLLGAAAVVAAACALGGPLGMRILYGHEYSASRLVFVALGIGVALYLLAATLSQALLAINAGRRAAAAWAVSGVALVVAYAALPGGEVTRVAVAFAVASFVLLLGLAGLVYRGGRA
jgi:O-antigen/teichoic acid export membrane protein